MGRGRRDKAHLTQEHRENLEQISCSDPPEGRAQWTIRLLTSELKKRQIVTEISCSTVWRTPKKTNYVLGKPNDSVFLNGI
jgi:hypothetical protein